MPRSKDVDAWLARYDNPMKAVVLRIREILLGADSRIEECIKWQAPTFTFRGNLASFYPKSKQHASLMFHMGARIPGNHPRLEGSGDTSRVLKIGSLAEANAARPDLEAIARAWCAWRESEADAPPARQKPPAAKTSRPRARAAKASPAAKPAQRGPAAAKKRPVKPGRPASGAKVSAKGRRSRAND